MNTKQADKIALAQARTLYNTLALLEGIGSELADSDLGQLKHEITKWIEHAK
jgi:hypothetical protein